MQHFLEARYREVWDATKRGSRLTEEAVAGSRFYFELSSGSPIPKRFDTYALLCGLPFAASLQSIFESYWQQCLSFLNAPLAYGVEPANRHTEIFLFQRPQEVFSKEEVNAAIAASLPIARELRSFKIVFCHPFITPDGTIVVPGYDEPAGIVESFRRRLRENLKTYPQKQSHWVHVSLGRILEPLDGERWQRLLQQMESRWGEVIAETIIDELLWIWEKQWYMVDREVLDRVCLREVPRERGPI